MALCNGTTFFHICRHFHLRSLIGNWQQYITLVRLFEKFVMLHLSKVKSSIGIRVLKYLALLIISRLSSCLVRRFKLNNFSAIFIFVFFRKSIKIIYKSNKNYEQRICMVNTEFITQILDLPNFHYK